MPRCDPTNNNKPRTILTRALGQSYKPKGTRYSIGKGFSVRKKTIETR